MNCIAWAPWEYGLILAAGTAQGRIVVFQRTAEDKLAKIYDFVAHQEGVNGISWGPSTLPAVMMPSIRASESDKSEAGMHDKFKLPCKRLVSGGNDNIVMMWEFFENAETRQTKIGEHSDWVRDVAWSNNIGLHHETIASCSEDGFAKVWRQVNDKEKSAWLPVEVKLAEKVPLWKVSWS